MSLLSFTLVVYCVVTVSCQDLRILVGDMRPGIHQVSLRDNLVTTYFIEELLRPIAVDFDVRRNDLYWTDVRSHQIWTRNLGTEETRLILTLNDSSVMDGIAVDASRRRLFYTDAGYDVIAIINTDGSGHEVIIDTGLDEPRAIVLYEERRKMYWTDWGTRPYIASASYEGTDITKIVTTGLRWPNGLALDKRNDVLYWCDGKTHRIEAVNVDGSGRRLVLSEPDTHYFDIFYMNEALFFTDWNRRAIMTVPARGGAVGFLTTERFEKLNGIHVMSTVGASDCQLGQYGARCDECGHCVKDTVCDKTTGVCLAGCSPRYTGLQCTLANPFWPLTTQIPTTQSTSRPRNTKPLPRKDVCHHGTPSRNADIDDNHSNNSMHLKHVILIATVAGIIVVLLIVVVIILAVVVLLRRKRELSASSKATEVNRPPNPYSVTSELPPAYSTVYEAGTGNPDFWAPVPKGPGGDGQATQDEGKEKKFPVVAAF